MAWSVPETIIYLVYRIFNGQCPLIFRNMKVGFGISDPHEREKPDMDPHQRYTEKLHYIHINVFSSLKSVLRIWDVYPGSEFFHPRSLIHGQKDSESGSASKN